VKQGHKNIKFIVSSTCFEHPSVHRQEGLYKQFYGFSFMHPLKQRGLWQDVLDKQGGWPKLKQTQRVWQFHPSTSHTIHPAITVTTQY